MGVPASATTRETLTRIIEMQPGSEAAARASYELGRIELDTGNVERATTSFRQVPATWPRWHARAGLAIGVIYETHWRDLDAATREYRKVIRMHPDCLPTAEAHARLGDIATALGDPVTAENMLECCVRACEKVLSGGSEAQEKDLALALLVTACRRLDRHDTAVEALIHRRREAIAARDAQRAVELDRELGHVYLERGQHGNALIRFKTCLQHARRKGTVASVVELTERVAECQRATGDIAGARRTYRTLVELLARRHDKKALIQKDASMALVVARAYILLDRTEDARKLRQRLAKVRGGEAAAIVAVIDTELASATP